MGGLPVDKDKTRKSSELVDLIVDCSGADMSKPSTGG
jgi:hypothetical protein